MVLKKDENFGSVTGDQQKMAKLAAHECICDQGDCITGVMSSNKKDGMLSVTSTLTNIIKYGST